MGKKTTYDTVIPKALVNSFVVAWNKLSGSSYDDRIRADDINHGWCYQFALVVKKVYKQRCTMYSNSSHVWVKINGLYYDSDHLCGVENYMDLGWFCRNPWRATTKRCEEYWNENGISGDVRWDVIEHAVKHHNKGRAR